MDATLEAAPRILLKKYKSQSVRKKVVSEIASLDYGNAVLLSPDQKSLVYLKENPVTGGGMSKSLEIYNLTNNTTKIIKQDFDINSSIWLVKWLPDSQNLLIRIENNYQLINTTTNKILNVVGLENIEMQNIHGWF